MAFLIGEMALALAGAAILGLVIGWALGGLGGRRAAKARDEVAGANPPAPGAALAGATEAKAPAPAEAPRPSATAEAVAEAGVDGEDGGDAARQLAERDQRIAALERLVSGHEGRIGELTSARLDLARKLHEKNVEAGELAGKVRRLEAALQAAPPQAAPSPAPAAPAAAPASEEPEEPAAAPASEEPEEPAAPAAPEEPAAESPADAGDGDRDRAGAEPQPVAPPATVAAEDAAGGDAGDDPGDGATTLAQALAAKDAVARDNERLHGELARMSEVLAAARAQVSELETRLATVSTAADAEAAARGAEPDAPGEGQEASSPPPALEAPEAPRDTVPELQTQPAPGESPGGDAAAVEGATATPPEPPPLPPPRAPGPSPAAVEDPRAAELERLREENARLRPAHAELKARAEILAAELERLRGDHPRIDPEGGTAREELAAKALALEAELTARSQALEAELAAKVEAFEADIQRLREENERFKADNEDAQRALDEQDGAIDQLTEELVRVQARSAELAQRLESATQDEQVARLEEELRSVKQAYEDAQRSLDEQDGAIDQLTEELVRIQQDVQEATARRDAARAASAPRPPGAPTSPMASMAPVSASKDGEEATAEAPGTAHTPPELPGVAGAAPASRGEVGAEPVDAIEPAVGSEEATGDPSRGSEGGTLSVRGVDLPFDPEEGGPSGPSIAATLAFAMARLERVHQDHVSTVERLSDARTEAERIRADLREARVMAEMADRERANLAAELDAARAAAAAERQRREAAERYAMLPWYAFKRKRSLRDRFEGPVG